LHVSARLDRRRSREAARNVVTIVPAFVAYVDSTQTVRLNAEHSAYRWVSFSEAGALVPFTGQRRLYEEVRREFVDRAPSPLQEINLDGDAGA
jgi:dATP pyrophosphohydrolase